MAWASVRHAAPQAAPEAAPLESSLATMPTDAAVNVGEAELSGLAFTSSPFGGVDTVATFQATIDVQPNTSTSTNNVAVASDAQPALFEDDRRLDLDLSASASDEMDDLLSDLAGDVDRAQREDESAHDAAFATLWG